MCNNLDQIVLVKVLHTSCREHLLSSNNLLNSPCSFETMAKTTHLTIRDYASV